MPWPLSPTLLNGCCCSAAPPQPNLASLSFWTLFPFVCTAWPIDFLPFEAVILVAWVIFTLSSRFCHRFSNRAALPSIDPSLFVTSAGRSRLHALLVSRIQSIDFFALLLLTYDLRIILLPESFILEGFAAFAYWLYGLFEAYVAYWWFLIVSNG